MQIHAVQFDIAWENRAENFQRVQSLLAKAEIAPGSLIVLPEMFSTGFSMNVEQIAELDPSETEQFLKELAAQFQSCVIGGLVFQNEQGRGYNELAAFNPDGNLLGRYRKNRTFRYTGESDHFENGTEHLIFEWGGFNISPFICYDLRFPELFRLAVSAGANLIPVIASWPVPRTEHWVTLLRARAIENLACVVGVNRCGTDPNHTYDGRSIIVDHLGEVLADAGKNPACLSHDVALQPLLDWRDQFPALLDLK